MSIDRLPNESESYRKLRAELLEAEIALKEQREKVAALRRKLPLDTLVETDYVFNELVVDKKGENQRQVRLSELFLQADKPLIVDHFMYGGAQSKPCPMCTMWADGYDAIIQHVTQRANFVFSC